MPFDATDTMLVDYGVDYGEVWRYIGIQPFDVLSVLQKKKNYLICCLLKQTLFYNKNWSLGTNTIN